VKIPSANRELFSLIAGMWRAWVSVLTIRKKRGDPRRVNKYQYSTLIILWLATTMRGLSGLMLSLLELLDPESENSVRHTFFFLF
jgi:hypothetical protein